MTSFHSMIFPHAELICSVEVRADVLFFWKASITLCIKAIISLDQVNIYLCVLFTSASWLSDVLHKHHSSSGLQKWCGTNKKILI